MKLVYKKAEYTNPVKKIKKGSFEVDKWIVSEFVLRNLEPIVSFKPFPLDELMLITSAVCWYKPDYVFEWGTHVGKSARIFYEIKKAFGYKYKITSIDLPEEKDHQEHPGKKRGVFVKNINEVKLISGEGLQVSIEKATKISSSRKLLFFLDGDHSYETVKKELSSINNLNHNFAILVHDTFYQIDASNYNVGPNNAVREFLDKNRSFKNISEETGLPGMTFIYK